MGLSSLDFTISLHPKFAPSYAVWTSSVSLKGELIAPSSVEEQKDIVTARVEL